MSNSTDNDGNVRRPELDETPPVLGSWRNIYVFVLGSLVALIVILAMITRMYS